MKTTQRTTLSAILMTATLAACHTTEQAPATVEIGLPYSLEDHQQRPSIIDAEVLVDIQASGCDDGPARLLFEQADRTVTTIDLPSPNALTRAAIGVKNFDLSGQSYPAHVQLTARLECLDGDVGQSQSVSFDLLPAAARQGDQALRLPGYFFWPQPDGTFVFCDDGALTQHDSQGQALAASATGLAHCTQDTRLERRAERWLIHHSRGLSALNESLEPIYALESQHIGIGQTVVASIERTQEEIGAPLRVDAAQIQDGAPLWSAILDDPDKMDHLVAGPLVEGEAVYALTASTGTGEGLLSVQYTLWKATEATAQNPEKVYTGTPETLSYPGGAGVVIPTGVLVSPTRALVVQGRSDRQVIGATSAVSLLDLAQQGRQIWSVEVQGHTSWMEAGEGQWLVASDDQVLRFDAHGQNKPLIYQVPNGYEPELQSAHPQGGAILRLRTDAPDDGRAVMLDAQMNEVWSVDHPWAMGTAWDLQGTAWMVTGGLLKLHTSADYRLLLQ